VTDVVEIEAKLLIPDRATFDQLLLCTAMAGFELAPPHALVVQDVYMDTAGRALLAGGFACRRRVQEGRIIITVKSVSTAGDSIHRRRELEVDLPQDLPPALWPASEARDTVVRLSGSAPLGELFRIRQERFARQVFDGGRVVALVSLDKVAVEGRAGESAWKEMEIELMPGGREKDLAAMTAWARARFRLQPSLLSKFERALREPA
jgi:inorganic triphosphatase YgiF